MNIVAKIEGQSEIIVENIVWYNIADSQVNVYGFDNIGSELLSQRIPRKVAENVSEKVLSQSGYAAGGRVRFWTDSKSITIKAEFGAGYHATCLSACAAYGLDLYILDEAGKETFFHTFRPPKNEMNYQTFQSAVDTQEVLVQRTDANGIFYTLNLPGFVEIKQLCIGLDVGSNIDYGKKYKNENPVIFYGSSITHGAAASHPGNTYEALISQKYNLNYVNLGFAGAALGEREMAQYIADREMHAFVCDYDHNSPSLEHLMKTHYAFYDIVRQKHPDIPYIMVTRPDFRRNIEDSEKRKIIIYSSYKRAIKHGDKNVYFIDGETLFDGDYYMSCTVDDVHPNDLGFFRMAEKIGKLLKNI